MRDQDSTKPRLHSESDWWVRLASFASQTEVERSIRVQRTRTAPTAEKKESKKGGFHISVWGPFLLSLVGSGPRFLNQRDFNAASKTGVAYSDVGSDSVAVG